jgi:NAD-dependent dihydropyrimidine dehydrogenase PreA subunit
MTSVVASSHQRLAEFYASHPTGGPANDTFVEILKYYFSPLEAHLATSMGFRDLEAESVIAGRAGVPADEAAAALTAMATRSWIRGLARPDGTRVFRLLPMVPGLYEMPFYLKDRTPDLEKLGNLYDRYYREGFGHELHGGKIQIVRVLPPKDGTPQEQVTPYEDVVKVLETHDRLYLMPCVCRLHYGRCESSVNVCISLFGPEVQAQMDSHVPVFDPAFAEVRHAIRPISVDEGIDILSRTEREGLVHVTSNVQDEPVFICNCCRCCCVLMRSITELTIPFGVAPSAFWMTVDQATCDGCQDCVERCPVDALAMEKVAGHKKLKAAVNHDLCLGCGVCSFVCPTDAMSLEQRNANIFIPPLNADEMYTIIGGARGRAWPVEPHHH